MGNATVAMGQVWTQVCEPKVSGETEVVPDADHPDHPGASRVPYNLMQGYYGSVGKIMRAGENFGTGLLINLADLPGVAGSLADPADQAIITATSVIPNKESAGSFSFLFDYVEEGAPGLAVPLDERKFFFGATDYVVVGLRNNQPDRRPMRLGMGLTDDEMPPQATITVVSHPGGEPREVSHGHITGVDSENVYYNAGAKAAKGSAVLFAHKRDLHVIALGLKETNSEKHEIVGVRASRFVEVMDQNLPPPEVFETVVPGEPAPPGSPKRAAPPGSPKRAPPVATGPTRIEDATGVTVKLKNGQSVTYTGKLKVPANVPHGAGSATYANGVIYEGSWSDGHRHGPGKISKEKEGYYSTGECEDDLFIGTWTKYSMKDNSFLEEHHYDHSNMDTLRRHLGFAPRTAVPKEQPQAQEQAPQIKAEN